MNTVGHGGWTHASVVALVATLLVGTGASPLLDGHEVEARKRGRDAAASSNVAALKVEAFSNATPIAIASNAQAAPSTITVSGFETNIADVNVTLNRLTHPQPPIWISCWSGRAGRRRS